MSASPIAVASADALATAPSAELRRRLIVLVAALALTVGLVVAPQPAHAATSPHVTTSNTLAFARQMLGLLNAERHAHGKRPLTMAYRLRVSAHRHNLRMAADNIMSHQLPGEAFFATRISRTGYRWRAAGENIGWNSDLTLRGLLNLEREMYHEVPPNDGHRVNILSSTFTQVGIDVVYDKTHRKIWFTQDFGAPAR